MNRTGAAFTLLYDNQTRSMLQNIGLSCCFGWIRYGFDTRG
ncbi:hypothetical protein RFN29_27650 [Mesorhizobium sp. VK22B]|uniref:Uncharacterized protein n=1 Tax=Mesorhizobium captivum TaxID=3072319 RepID=A0ABU4Z9T7_9HYPH|nr:MULTISPECIES: hypothetical protein [unclassified Mesorhizobium]MDX8495338.1 hypothetical protein [Mesorhizobium sp. VK22B]MDX8510164.1 hypothetical protein [Mesorhizobium sp. VK22E]